MGILTQLLILNNRFLLRILRVFLLRPLTYCQEFRLSLADWFSFSLKFYYYYYGVRRHEGTSVNSLLYQDSCQSNSCCQPWLQEPSPAESSARSQNCFKYSGLNNSSRRQLEPDLKSLCMSKMAKGLPGVIKNFQMGRIL